MIILNPTLNPTTLFYDSDNNNVDWNVKYSLTNNSELLVNLSNYSYLYQLITKHLTKRELIELHLTGFKLVRLLNGTNTKFKYKYYLTWFDLIKLILFK